MGHKFLQIVAVSSAAAVVVVVVVVEIVMMKEEEEEEREAKGEAVTVRLSIISECPLTV